jgi:hypothetical protein
MDAEVGVADLSWQWRRDEAWFGDAGCIDQ